MEAELSGVENTKAGPATFGGRRLPAWLRVSLPRTPVFSQTRELLRALRLCTVCESARCPNHWECWDRGTATFMICGDHCTRACRFCAVTRGRPLPLDPDEPQRVAEAVRIMRLKHAVITSVARDDLADGGAEHFARTIKAVRAVNPEVAIEVLTPDFNDDDRALDIVFNAQPDIFNHNIETVRRLTPNVRSRATYEKSLSVLRKARQRLPADCRTKSGLMLGLGEQIDEVLEAFRDLRAVGCEILTVGQYLRPTGECLPVAEYVPPESFDELGKRALAMGFTYVASAPRVRSSYRADCFAGASTGG